MSSRPRRTPVTEDDHPTEAAPGDDGGGTDRRLLAAGVVTLLVVAAAAAFATGLGPAPGGDSGDEITDFPTATPPGDDGEMSAADASSAATADATATPAPRPAFGFTVDSVEECGQTCRDVTSTLENTGDESATAVTVYTRIYAGQGTDGDVVWAGTEDVGSLDPSATYTGTNRVELSLSGAAKVENGGGWITVQTTVQSDQRTVTFANERRVA
jgi:hypothetical protein